MPAQSMPTGNVQSNFVPTIVAGNRELPAGLTAANGVHDPYPGVIVRKELITPDVAFTMLELNTSNYRRLSGNNAKKITSDLKEGSGVLSPDCIAFDENGVMYNGQHRCEGIIESGVPLWCLVVREVPIRDATAAAIDSGKKRVAADHLRQEGFHNGTTLGSAVRMLYRLASSGATTFSGKHEPLSETQIMNLARTPGLTECVDETRGVSGFNPTGLAVWYWLASIENKDLARTCLKRFSLSELATTSDPFVRCRDALMARKQKGSVLAEETVLYLMSAWEKAKQGRTSKAIRPLKKMSYTPEVWAQLSRFDVFDKQL